MCEGGAGGVYELIPCERFVQEPARTPVLPTHSKVQYLIRNECLYLSIVNLYSFFFRRLSRKEKKVRKNIDTFTVYFDYPGLQL